MKKVIFCFAAALALLSCSKKGPDPSAPTVSWESNADFAVQEMGDSNYGTITVSCTSGIAGLQIKATNITNEDCRIIFKKWIGIQTYKSSMTADLIGDTSLADLFQQRGIATPVGKDLVKAKNCTLNFKALLDALAEGLPLENGARFAFEIIVSNASGLTVTKTASFRWTAAATFPDDVPSIYWLRPDDTNKLEMTIAVPGKVGDLTISFGGEKADAGILAFIKKKSASKSTVIDLVNDKNVEQAFHMAPVAKNAAQVNLDLSDLMQDLGYECSTGSSTDMTVTVTDILGKVSSHTIALMLDGE